jgi:spermidine synthase
LAARARYALAVKRLALALYFLSGAAGLVYEVVWTRMMTHVFGATALAIGTVLAAFMTGLALGSWLLGRIADRVGNPLRLYAILEIAVALAATIAHVLLSRVTPAYLAVYEAFGRSDAALAVARFLLSFVLILAPTVLMGATLPAFARFVVRRLSGVGADLSTLYAINTMGAVAGALAAGFYLIGTFGVHGAVAAAVLGNLSVGAAAWLASGRLGTESDAGREAPDPITAAPEAAQEQRPIPVVTHRLLLAGLAVSGLTSFAYEVYWTRCLHFITGNSTYALTTTLVAFLTGIALGGYLVRFAMGPGRDRVATFGWIQILIAVAAATAMPFLFNVLEPDRLRVDTWGAAGGFWTLVFHRFGVSFLVMLLPACLIGATFPLAGAIGVRRLGEAGATVGRIYAANTVGNVLGALLPGLVLLHWLDIQPGILAMATLNLLGGLALLTSRLREVRPLRWAIPAALALVLLVAFRVPPELRFPLAAEAGNYRVLYRRDGPSATTAVLLNPDTRERIMTVDGVTIGGNGATDYKQQILAHLPKLLVEDVSQELSVGLGSGLLVRESARHARVDSAITCVEIEPTVVEGSAWFPHDPREHRPRVRVVVDDVANYLKTTPRSYSVVSADEKTAEEFASNGFSYSLDYYRMLRRRLKSDGLVIQWVPTDLPPRQYRMVLKTFSEAFPYVSMWCLGPTLMIGSSNTFLIGSIRPVDPDLRRARAWMEAEPSAFGGLARYGIRTPEVLFAQRWAGREAIARATSGDHVNTLDHPRYEFYTPRDYATTTRRRLAENFDFLLRLRRFEPGPSAFGATPGSPEDSLLRAVRAAEEEYLLGCRALLHGAAPREGIEHFDRAIGIAPWNDNLRARVFAQYWDLAGRFLAEGNFEATADLDRRGLEVYDRDALSHVEYALALERIGDIGHAIESAQRGLALEPDLVAARRVLATLLLRAGRPAESRAQFQAILAIEPGDEEARQALREIANGDTRLH